MSKYLWKNVLVYGSDSSRGEKAAAIIILLAIFVLTVWMDPV